MYIMSLHLVAAEVLLASNIIMCLHTGRRAAALTASRGKFSTQGCASSNTQQLEITTNPTLITQHSFLLMHTKPNIRRPRDEYNRGRKGDTC